MSYKISPKANKCTFTREEWYIHLFDKIVHLDVTVMWRWGDFSIYITEEQKKEIETSEEEVILSDYDFELINLYDGCERFVEIRDENDYTKDEIKEIYKKIYLTDEKIYDEDILEENGWFLEDTVTYIVNGVTIE